MDREYQRKLLETLAARFPDALDPTELDTGPDERKLHFNAAYLHEHGLIAAKFAGLPGEPLMLVHLKATARGLDFLQADGGLGAILNVVTVRLDAETLRSLIEDKIDAANLPAEEKSKFMAWLKSAGSEALSEATKRLVGAALDQAPDVLPLLRMLTG